MNYLINKYYLVENFMRIINEWVFGQLNDSADWSKSKPIKANLVCTKSCPTPLQINEHLLHVKQHTKNEWAPHLPQTQRGAAKCRWELWG